MPVIKDDEGFVVSTKEGEFVVLTIPIDGEDVLNEIEEGWAVVVTLVLTEFGVGLEVRDAIFGDADGDDDDWIKGKPKSAKMSSNKTTSPSSSSFPKGQSGPNKSQIASRMSRIKFPSSSKCLRWGICSFWPCPLTLFEFHQIKSETLEI